MSKLQFLYARLPVYLQQGACSLEGWRIQRQRYGKSFQAALQDAEERMSWSQERIKAYQDERLHHFVQHCAQTVPYYRRLFQEYGITPEKVYRIEDLQNLPILTKQEVKDNYEALLSQAIPKSEWINFQTGGTTGNVLRFVTTRRALDEQWAGVWRFRRAHGIQLDTWCGYFGGRPIVPLQQKVPPFWRYNYPGKQILFSGYHMSPRNLDAYVKELHRRRPPYLQGYPSLLSLLAAHMVEFGRYLDYQPRWIVVNSENLLPQQAKLIEQAFGVRPIQRYAMGEAIASASECLQGKLHIDEDLAATEFMPNPDGFGHRVVGTALTNLAVPLLRYDVGDVVTLSNEGCSCGRPGRILETVDGRKEDYIILEDGSRIGILDQIFKEIINIHEAQIYQRRVGEMIIRVVRGKNYNDHDEIMILQEAKKRVGSSTEVKIDYVENLQRSRNGKLRFVVSDIKAGQLESTF